LTKRAALLTKRAAHMANPNPNFKTNPNPGPDPNLNRHPSLM